MQYKNLLAESQRVLQDLNEAYFMRLPGNVINNELYVAQKALASIYSSLKNGDDFDDKAFSALIKKLNDIRKEAKSFKPGDDVPTPFQYKDK